MDSPSTDLSNRVAAANRAFIRYSAADMAKIGAMSQADRDMFYAGLEAMPKSHVTINPEADRAKALVFLRGSPLTAKPVELSVALDIARKAQVQIEIFWDAMISRFIANPAIYVPTPAASRSPLSKRKYNRPKNTDGLVKLATVFGPRYATRHDWEAKNNVVAIAEGEADFFFLNRCYIVGVWPQPRKAVAALKKSFDFTAEAAKSSKPSFLDIPGAFAATQDFLKRHGDVTGAEWDKMRDLAEDCATGIRHIGIASELGDVALGAFILTNYAEQSLDHLLDAVREARVAKRAS